MACDGPSKIHHEASMILGIACTVVLGMFALWQTRRAATAYARGYGEAVQAWRAVLDIHEAQHRVLKARHDTFVAGIQRCQEPGVCSDVRAMHRAIHDAAVAANQAAAAAHQAAAAAHESRAV